MEYKFYGHEHLDIRPKSRIFTGIERITDLYDFLLDTWSKETCAPRLRDKWSIDNPTVGQCSITAFLVQDIFGGDVYGVKLDDGNYHCYNVVDGKAFDLTSEQFDYPLTYDLTNKQDREVHFQKEEKYLRYLNLVGELCELPLS